MAVSAAELQQLYLAYFGRPADPGGLAYYTSQAGLSIWDVASAFSASPESQSLYGPAFGESEIQRIYHNLFNRDAEADGVLYWSHQVASGKLTAAGAALGILLGAQNGDAVTIANKLLVAGAFTAAVKSPEQVGGYSGDLAAGAVRDYFSGIGSDPKSAALAVLNIQKVIPLHVTDSTAGGVSLDAVPSGATLVLTGDAQTDTVNVSGALTGTADRLHIELSKDGAITGATVNASHVETFQVSANDTTLETPAASHVQSLSLVADGALTITIDGNAALKLSAGSSPQLQTVDATAMSGSLTYSTLAGGTQHVIGGASADVLESHGVLDRLTGGAGHDTFVIGVTKNLNTYATITDASAGDLLKLANSGGGAATFAHAQVTLADTAVFQDYANAVVDAGGNASVNPSLGWFQWGGDTYLVASEHDASAAHGFVSGVDLIVKLAGLLDLSTASLNATPGAAALVQINP
jgi:hypothetical protein